MSENASKHSRAEVLAAEFADALRRGDSPSVDDYVSRSQECGPELREMLLTILAMEQLKEQNEPAPPTNPHRSIEIGRLGDLRLVREIGRGGMGVVYKAVQESLGRTVAVKVLPKDRLNSDQALARFQRESKTAASLHHTNIVPVLGVGTDDGYHYYVMQYIRGVGLDQVIRHLREESSLGSAEQSPTFDLSSVARQLIESLEQDSAVATAQSHTVTQDAHVSPHFPDRPQSSSSVDARDSDTSLRRLGGVYWRSVAWIAHRIASAMHYAHDQGVLHRDIKPSNLLIDSQGIVSVADFGLAKTSDQAAISRTGDIVGTLRFMAPEQLSGETDSRSDVYSLGVTLYELATLRAAFDDAQLARTLARGSALQALRPRQVRSEIPANLETIIVKAMAKDPAHRYQTAAELSDDLLRFYEDRPILAKRTGIVEHFWRWSRRNPAVATLCVFAATMLVTVAIVSTTAYYRTNQSRQEAIEQRNKADQTAEIAFAALDEIFQGLAPMPMVNPDPFAVADEDQIHASTTPKPTKQTAALLEKMLTFYDRIATSGQTDARHRTRLAEAHRRIGDIRQRLGQIAIASESYRRSADLYHQIIDSERSPELAARLAAVHNELGICLHHLRRQQPEGAAASSKRQRSHGAEQFQMARLLLEPIAATDSSPAVRYELAHTYYLLGDKPRDSSIADQPARAPELLQTASELLRSLVKQYPESPAYQRLLAMCYLEIAKGPSMTASARGQKLRSDAIELLKVLAETYPENPDYQFALCSAYASGRVNSPDLDRNAIRKYVARLETAESLALQLRSEYPALPQYLSAHLKIFRQLGALHRRLADRGAELAVCRRAVQVCRNALPDSITNMNFKAVIETYGHAAQLLIADQTGDRQEVLLETREVLEAAIDSFDQRRSRTGVSGDGSMRDVFVSELADLRKRLGDASPTEPPATSR